MNKKEYIQARKDIKEYEENIIKQKDKENNTPCFILIDQAAEGFKQEVIVTTDKDFANRIYDSGYYIIINSRIMNP